LNNLGYVLLGQNRAQDAVPYFEQAVRLSQTMGRRTIIDLGLVALGSSTPPFGPRMWRRSAV